MAVEPELDAVVQWLTVRVLDMFAGIDSMLRPYTESIEDLQLANETGMPNTERRVTTQHETE